MLLVAGGIGVTPFRAMLDGSSRGAQPITLLYCVRTLQEAAFLHDFQKAKSYTGL